LRKNGTYIVRIQKDNFYKCKTLKNLEEAIKFKQECLEEIKKIQEENKLLHFLIPITYNKEGIPYISVKYKKGNKEYECLVDEDKWHELTFMKTWFRNPNGYIKANINGNPSTLIHRFLYETYKSQEDITNLQIDHKNRNKLDNRMENLRPSTSGQNNHNQEIQNSTGYRGVKQNRNSGYCARIKHEGNEYYSKYFKTIEEAALAYNELSLKYYGEEFTELNIITNSN
jgi:hypothetical protein